MMQRRWALLGCCLVLTGCVTAPRERPAAFWSGRLGLQLQTDPPQNLQAAFELQGSASQGELTLFSPVGTVLAQLSWTPWQATLERGQERWTQDNVEQLTEQLVQTPLPIHALFGWIEGRAVTPAGWEVDLSAHDQGRIVARRDLPAPPAVLRILLDPPAP